MEAALAREVLAFLAPSLRRVLAGAKGGAPWLEVRLGIGRPLLVVTAAGDAFLAPDGRAVTDPERAYQVTEDDVRRTVELMSGSSLYALDEELRQAFLTLPGGHRVGLCGRVVVRGGSAYALRDIVSLNVRLARQVPGAADAVLPWILGEDGLPVSTLVISPPGAGKTTLLRDLARQLFRGRPDLGCPGLRVGVVDERLELGGGGRGGPALDLGPRTDVLEGCPKAAGLVLLVRAMGPQVVVTDEVGRPEDVEALRDAARMGVRLLASAHAGSAAEAAVRPVLRDLLADGCFGRLVRLGCSRGPGTVEEVRDASGGVLYRRGEGRAGRWPAWTCARP